MWYRKQKQIERLESRINGFKGYKQREELDKQFKEIDHKTICNLRIEIEKLKSKMNAKRDDFLSTIAELRDRIQELTPKPLCKYEVFVGDRVVEVNGDEHNFSGENIVINLTGKVVFQGECHAYSRAETKGKK